MIPSGLGAFVVLLALVPGWLYLRLRSQLRPTSRRSTLDELLEVVAVGFGTTGVAALAVALVPHSWLPFTLNIDEWAYLGETYLRDNVRGAAATAAVILGVALAIASLLHLVDRRNRRPEFHPEGSVWVLSLGARPEGKVPWVGLTLDDGRLVEGVLHSFSLETQTDDRDVALMGPLRVRSPNELEGRWVKVDRLIVPYRRIDHIVVLHVDERERAPRPRRWQRFRR